MKLTYIFLKFVHALFLNLFIGTDIHSTCCTYYLCFKKLRVSTLSLSFVTSVMSQLKLMRFIFLRAVTYLDLYRAVELESSAIYEDKMCGNIRKCN